MGIAIPQVRPTWPARPDPTLTSPAGPLSGRLPSNELSRLYFAIEAARTSERSLIVQFVGAGGGEGVSTVAAGYAHAAAREPGRTTLILHCQAAFHANHRGTARKLPELFAAFRADRLLDACLSLRADEAPSEAGGAVRSAALGGAAERDADPRMLDAFADALRNEFGLIVLDCAPVAASPLVSALARIADGTVLVVAAGLTRRREVERAIAEITGLGGQVVGFVLNRQRNWLRWRTA